MKVHVRMEEACNLNELRNEVEKLAQDAKGFVAESKNHNDLLSMDFQIPDATYEAFRQSLREVAERRKMETIAAPAHGEWMVLMKPKVLAAATAEA